MNWKNAIVIVAALAAYALVAGFPGTAAAAVGTAAGTTIRNTVTVGYQMSGTAYTASTSASFAVDRKINLTVTKLADASVTAGQSNAALSFLVSNTSNTAVRFGLTPLSKATVTASTAPARLRQARATSWTMNNVRIYRDSNNNGVWDAGDTLYADASTFGDVASGASLTVLIVADAPAVLTSTLTAQYDLVAAAVDAGTLNVTAQTTGVNTTGIDTVFADGAGSAAGDAAKDGRYSAAASYTPVPAILSVTKSVTVQDQYGGTQALPGATLHYTITATVTGSGNANNTVITDPVPQNTGYIANTLRLNGASLTDALDGDAGDVGGTTTNTVTVKLGTLTNASASQTITFDVRIK